MEWRTEDFTLRIRCEASVDRETLWRNLVMFLGEAVFAEAAGRIGPAWPRDPWGQPLQYVFLKEEASSNVRFSVTHEE